MEFTVRMFARHGVGRFLHHHFLLWKEWTLFVINSGYFNYGSIVKNVEGEKARLQVLILLLPLWFLFHH
jgi:hypothetical protein